MSLSFVTFAAKLPGKASELGDIPTHGSACSNEPPIYVSFALTVYVYINLYVENFFLYLCNSLGSTMQISFFLTGCN